MSSCMQRSPLPSIVSESTLLNFVAGPGFDAAVAAQFREHDADADGCLSHSELHDALRSLRLVDHDDYVGYEEQLLAAAWPPGVDADAEDRRAREEDHERKREAVFKLFDADGDGVVSAHEFATQMREVVLGMARGLRGCPLHMLLHSGSILSHAVHYEETASLLV